MATRAVSKTVNPGSNPGSPAEFSATRARTMGLSGCAPGRGARFSEGDTYMPRTSVTGMITAALAAFAAVAVLAGGAQARPAGMAAMTDSCPGSDEAVT